MPVHCIERKPLYKYKLCHSRTRLSSPISMGEEAEELVKFKFGHALWWPEHTKDPNGRDHDIEIGDVGYIDGDGAFHVLFNVIHDADHALSAPGHALNSVFSPLRYDSSSIETKERFRTPEDPVCGSSISEHKVSVQLAACVYSSVCPIPFQPML